MPSNHHSVYPEIQDQPVLHCIGPDIFSCCDPGDDSHLGTLVKQWNIKSLVNTRIPDEEEYEDKSDLASKFGVKLLNFPISSLDILTPNVTKLFHQQLLQLPHPILVFCRSGCCSFGMALLHHALRSGLNQEQLLQKELDLSALFPYSPVQRKIDELFQILQPSL